ncbi:hypothetical protein M0802_003469 [Mischocyttarus mexicanus]|nr:hypothetical protein M0802_003469 [Mischocyttarus mexicanus]
MGVVQGGGRYRTKRKLNLSRTHSTRLTFHDASTSYDCLKKIKVLGEVLGENPKDLHHKFVKCYDLGTTWEQGKTCFSRVTALEVSFTVLTSNSYSPYVGKEVLRVLLDG